ncbi:MAG: nuclear transport factor 2 family protein [Chloroflexota bacterium]
MTQLDHAAAADLLDRYRRAWETFDGDAWANLFSEDIEYAEDPFEPPLVGRNAVRAYLLEAAENQQQVEVTIERHWVVPPTVLASWHASYIRRRDRARVRLAGFMTLELEEEGRIAQFHEWYHHRKTAG